MADDLPELPDISLVEQTGFALVHEGEYVVRDAGSSARLTAVGDGAGLVLEFPVQVEIRVVSAGDPEEHAELALTRLLRAVEGLA
jgi:hypothetical protein